MSVLSHSRNDYQRPQSSGNMCELHIYVVPPELWEERQNLAFNQIISETISAGFVRIDADTFVGDLRLEIDRQLGAEVIPKDYVFCKSVGRCLAQVREKQENLLKVKHFLPPNSFCPELFIVDSLVAKRSPTSDSRKTNSSNSERPYLTDPYIYFRGPELRTGRSNIAESSDREDLEAETNHEYEGSPKADNVNGRIKEIPTKEDQNSHENFEYKKFENDYKNFEQSHPSKTKQRQNSEKEKLTNHEFENDNGNFEQSHPSKTKQRLISEKEKLTNHELVMDTSLHSRRNEIDNLQKEIMKRYQDLDNLEKEHERKLLEWEADEEKRKLEEVQRRKMFEQMELERRRQEEAIIFKQREELKKLEELLITKHKEIEEAENKLLEEKENRIKIMENKQKEINELKDKLVKDSNPDESFNGRLLELQKEIEEMEGKQNQLIEATMTERLEAEKDFKRAQLEFENLKTYWEKERKEREKLYADKIAEEERLRAISEEKRKEHEQRMEEERRRMIEEREKFEEEQRHWEKERMRYEEEEKRRMEEMELAIQEAYNNKPVVAKFEIKDPELVLEGATEIEQINHLKQILKSAIAERQQSESRREEAIRKIRASQMNVHTKRNQIRDFWKKRYFEEKKKTPPLEDQLARYREEIEILHKKLLGFMESGLREHRKLQKRNGIMSPSNKANLMLQAARIQHEIENLQRQIEHCQMRLSAEMKLRSQTETELKVLRIEAMQNKIRLSRTRSDQLVIMAAGHNSVVHSYEYTTTPRNMPNFTTPPNDRFLQN